MRKAQKNGLNKVKRNSKRQQLISTMKHKRRRELKTKWQEPAYFQTNRNAQISFKGYKTPEQIKARVKKMKGKKSKGKVSISSLWS